MKRALPLVGFLTCLVILAAAVVPGAAWRLLSPRPLGVAILDKTVPDTSYRGHRALIWVLNHLKFVHPASLAPYDAATDYAGFVPLTGRAWTVRPLPADIGSDRVVYVADTYGVTAADLGEGGSGRTGRLLYGGLTPEELGSLTDAARSGATLIGEFNTAAEPTVDSLRLRVEALFGFRWTGWTGRHSAELREDVPPWAVAAWEQQAGQPWKHEGPGILLANRDGRVLVLTARELRGGGLDIVPTRAGDSLGMRDAPAPDGWFDLVEPAGGTPLAQYAWRLTPRGDSLFTSAAVPRLAVAAIAYKAGASRTYYLAGDFANTAVVPRWTGLRWAPQFYKVLPAWWLPPRESFFWRGYVPLITSHPGVGLGRVSRVGGRGRRRLALPDSGVHIYPLCTLHPVRSPSPFPAGSTPPTACPGWPSRGGPSTPSTSTPAAHRPSSARPSGAGRRGRCRRAPRGRRAPAGVRPLCPLPDPGQRAPRKRLSAERGRRTDPAGAVRDRRGPGHRGRRRGARLHRRRQRPGAVRRRLPRARRRSPDRHADPGRRPFARPGHRLSHGARPSGPGQGGRLLHQSRDCGAPRGAGDGPTTRGPVRRPNCSTHRPTHPLRGKS